jgi:hypothetical protein
MHARVARFEGGEADAIRAAADEIRTRSEGGPPEGLPAVGLLMLIDPDNGRGLTISLFDSEEDMRKGDETLNSMTPPTKGMGERSSVEMYEVAVERRL